MSGWPLTPKARVAKVPTVQRITNPLHSSNAPRQLLLWLCGVLAVALTMSRHWVICTHDDGDAHLEINHAQGNHDEHVGCDCQHDHGRERECDGDAGHAEDAPADPHDTCSHVDLLVEIGPKQEPDSIELPLVLAFELPASNSGVATWRITTKRSLPPPATGPPRPRSFLAARATQVLLI